MSLFAQKRVAQQSLAVGRTIPGTGPAYDVRPAREMRSNHEDGLARGRSWLAPFAFAKNIGQGACAGLLTFLGALHLTQGVQVEAGGLASLTNLDAGMLATLAQQLTAGGGAGAIEIVGAAALFLNAGRGWGRVIGLLGFVLIAAAHANGADHAALIGDLTELYEAGKALVARFSIPLTGPQG